MVPRPRTADRRRGARRRRLSAIARLAPALAAGAIAALLYLPRAADAQPAAAPATAQPSAPASPAPGSPGTPDPSAQPEAPAPASADAAEGGASRTPDGLEPKLRIRHYDVAGDTVDAVRAELVRRGPRGFHAWTEWRVEYRIRWSAGSDGRCRLAGTELDITADMLLPRWTPVTAPAPGLPEHWSRYSDALRTHEDGHVALAREAARDARARMLAVGPTACDRLPVEVRRAFDAAMSKARTEERAYDARTSHGGAQGATF